MGYEKTIKINVDKLSPKYLNSTIFTDKEIEMSKLELLTYCMQDHSTDTNYEVIKRIQYLTELRFQVLRQKCLREICDRIKEEGEIWFCGWQFSHESDYEYNELMKNAVEQLVMLTTCAKTPDYFDDDEKFSKKWREVSEWIDAEEEIYDIVGHEFIEEYGDYKDDEEEEYIPTSDLNDSIENNDNA